MNRRVVHPEPAMEKAPEAPLPTNETERQLSKRNIRRSFKNSLLGDFGVEQKEVDDQSKSLLTKWLLLFSKVMTYEIPLEVSMLFEPNLSVVVERNEAELTRERVMIMETRMQRRTTRTSLQRRLRKLKTSQTAHMSTVSPMKNRVIYLVEKS